MKQVNGVISLVLSLVLLYAGLNGWYETGLDALAVVLVFFGAVFLGFGIVWTFFTKEAE